MLHFLEVGKKYPLDEIIEKYSLNKDRLLGKLMN